ncbi:MAG: hypothetical protein ACJ73S_16395 [Mycobacteriales bacterium]
MSEITAASEPTADQSAPRDWLTRERKSALGEQSLNRFASTVGVSVRTAMRWESGHTRGLDPWLDAIAQALRLRPDDVHALEEDYRAGMLTRIPILSWDVEGALAAARLITSNVTGVATGGGVAGGMAAAGAPAGPATDTAPADDLPRYANGDYVRPVLSWVSAAPVEDAGRGGAVEVTAELIEEHQAALRQLRLHDDRTGGADLLPAARLRVRRLAALLDRGGYDDALGRRLFAAYADACQFAGWCAYEARMHDLAFQHWVAALHGAHVASTGGGAGGHAAHVLLTMAWQACQLGRGHDGMILAHTAESKVREEDSKARGLIAARQALAAARVGDRGAFLAVLERAQQHLDIDRDAAGDRDGPPDHHWAYHFDHASLMLHSGISWLSLDEPAQAEKDLAEAIAYLHPSYVRNRALALANLAMARLAQPRPDIPQVVATADQALVLATTHLNSNQVTHQILALDRSLAQYRRRAPAARDFHERCHQLSP